MADDRDEQAGGGRWPKQLVVMVSLQVDETVRLAVDVSGRSMSDILREVIDEGLPPVVGRIKRSRRLLAASLAEVQGPAA